MAAATPLPTGNDERFRGWASRREAKPARLVDSTALPYYADLMDLHVPPELEAKLDRLAAATGRRPDQLALDLLASSVEHDDWLRTEVERGRESARAGRLLDHDDVVSRINQRYSG